MAPIKPSISRPIARHDLVFVPAARGHSFVAFMQPLWGLPGNGFVADRQAFCLRNRKVFAAGTVGKRNA
jgi:hypothetical protein